MRVAVRLALALLTAAAPLAAQAQPLKPVKRTGVPIAYIHKLRIIAGTTTRLVGEAPFQEGTLEFKGERGPFTAEMSEDRYTIEINATRILKPGDRARIKVITGRGDWQFFDLFRATTEYDEEFFLLRAIPLGWGQKPYPRDPVDPALIIKRAVKKTAAPRPGRRPGTPKDATTVLMELALSGLQNQSNGPLTVVTPRSGRGTAGPLTGTLRETIDFPAHRFTVARIELKNSSNHPVRLPPVRVLSGQGELRVFQVTGSSEEVPPHEWTNLLVAYEMARLDDEVLLRCAVPGTRDGLWLSVSP